MKNRFVSLLSSLVLAAVPVAAQNGKPDAEGFIRDWLVLSPYSIGDNFGADAIDKKQSADEAKPASAKAGGKQKVGEQELVWKKIATKNYYIDFRELHPEQFEQVAAWAVAYVVSSD